MKIKDIIDYLEKNGEWVDWNNTRDRILIGKSDQSVHKVGVCWVVTHQVIDYAIENHVNFIITHENPFYLSSTKMNTNVFNARNIKKNRLENANITVYRCHDMWDCCPGYGIADLWVKKLDDIIIKKKRNGFYSYVTVNPMTVKDLGIVLSKKMVEDGENGVYIFGDLQKEIQRIALGTGAATDVFKMDEEDPDVFIVSEDGINCWSSVQYVLDSHKAVIIVSHSCCEKAGLKQLPHYIQQQYHDLDIEYIEDGVNPVFIAV